MSFGFSVNDFVTCIQLARKVWQDCRDAPKDFLAVSNEVASLQLVLSQVQETIDGKELTAEKKENLGTIVQGCSKTLQELQALLKKRKSLGTQSRRTWDRLCWGKEQVDDIRQQVISNTGLLTSFNVGLVGSGMARIEAMLQQLMLERQSGLRERSVISVESIASAQEGDEDVWYQIGRELEDVGITPDMVNEHRLYITAWIKEALGNGNLDENSVLVSPDPDTLSSKLPCQASSNPTVRGRKPITQGEYAGDRSDVTPESPFEEPLSRGNTSDTYMGMAGLTQPDNLLPYQDPQLPLHPNPAAPAGFSGQGTTTFGLEPLRLPKSESSFECCDSLKLFGGIDATQNLSRHLSSKHRNNLLTFFECSEKKNNGSDCNKKFTMLYNFTFHLRTAHKMAMSGRNQVDREYLQAKRRWATSEVIRP